MYDEIPYMMENTPEEFDRVLRIAWFEPEPCRGQLQIPFDTEDTYRIYGVPSDPADLKLRYGVRVIREDKGRC